MTGWAVRLLEVITDCVTRESKRTSQSVTRAAQMVGDAELLSTIQRLHRITDLLQGVILERERKLVD